MQDGERDQDDFVQDYTEGDDPEESLEDWDGLEDDDDDEDMDELDFDVSRLEVESHRSVGEPYDLNDVLNDALGG